MRKKQIFFLGDLRNMNSNSLNQKIAYNNNEFFKMSIMKDSSMLILSELTLDGHKYTDFFGYDFAMKYIIEKKLNVDLAFVSFLTREQLKNKTENSRLLAPIFPHFQLPVDFDKIEIPHISEAKWDYIRNYMLEPGKGGKIDKIAHDIKNIYFSLIESNFINSEKLKNVSFLLNNFKKYLPDEVISEQKYFELEKITDSVELAGTLKKLQWILEDNYKLRTNSFVKRKLSKTKYKVLLIDDEKPILEELENKLKPYFDVVSFTNGNDALAELKKNHKLISAAFIDIELLNTDGGWQETFGIDILEEAIKYPHLAVYMTTGLSKRAYSLILTNLKSKFEFEPKPLRKSPEELYEQLIKIIREKQKYLKGPQIGLWKTGLFQRYLELKETVGWNDFLKSIHDDLDEFLKNNYHSFSKIFGDKHTEQTLSIDNIKDIIKHRMANLFINYDRGFIDFEMLKENFKIAKSIDSKKYYWKLGLSYFNKSDKLILKTTHLLDEEKEWLKSKLSNAISLPSINFVNLWDEIDNAYNQIPTSYHKDIKRPEDNLESIIDFIHLITIRSVVLRDLESVVNGFSDYINCSEYKEEIRRLSEFDQGNEILKLIKLFIDE